MLNIEITADNVPESLVAEITAKLDLAGSPYQITHSDFPQFEDED